MGTWWEPQKKSKKSNPLEKNSVQQTLITLVLQFAWKELRKLEILRVLVGGEKRRTFSNDGNCGAEWCCCSIRSIRRRRRRRRRWIDSGGAAREAAQVCGWMARPSVRDSGEISRQWIDGCCCFYQCWRHQPWSSSYHHCLFWWSSSWCHSSRYHSNQESVQQSDDCVVFWLPPDRSSATTGLKSNPIHSTLLLCLLPLFNSHEFNLPFMENLGYIWISSKP